MKSPKQADTHAGPKPADSSRLRFTDYLLLTAAAFISPLSHMAGNYWQLVHPERGLLVGAVAAVLACAVASMISRRGGGRMAAVFPVLVTVLVLTKTGRLLWQFPPILGWTLAVVAVALSWFLSKRLSESLLQIVAVILVVAMGSGAVVDAYNAFSAMGQTNIVESKPVDIQMSEQPDIYFVVVDGYLGLAGLEAVLGESKDSLVSGLTAEGFQVPHSAWSPYSSTELAVPSILDMSYPADPSDLNSRTRIDLHAIISGQNNTVAALRENGYQTTMIEATWVGSACSSAFDRCVDSFWLDSVLFAMAFDSMASRWVVDRFGHTFTASAQYSMDALRELRDEYEDNGRADFVFAHLLLPHPPYFLDATCELVPDPSRFEVAFAEIEDPSRDEQFVVQSECADAFMVSFAGDLAEEDVVVFAGDHGVRRHPLQSDGEKPGEEAVLELMNVFVAARLKEGCDLADPLLTSDLLRQVLSCYASSEVEAVPQRMFLRGGYEMSDEEIDELLTEFP